MTEIIDRIDMFVVDIYYLLPQRLKNDFVTICTDFSKRFDHEYFGNAEMMELKNALLNHLFKVMETGDFIKMANALELEVKPVLSDMNVFIRNN